MGARQYAFQVMARASDESAVAKRAAQRHKVMLALRDLHSIRAHGDGCRSWAVDQQLGTCAVGDGFQLSPNIDELRLAKRFGAQLHRHTLTGHVRCECGSHAAH